MNDHKALRLRLGEIVIELAGLLDIPEDLAQRVIEVKINSNGLSVEYCGETSETRTVPLVHTAVQRGHVLFPSKD